MQSPTNLFNRCNIQQDLHHILKYIPKDSLHCSNMYQTDTTISCSAFADLDKCVIWTQTHKQTPCGSKVQKQSSLEGLHRPNQREVLGRSQCKALTSVRCDYFTGFTSSPAEKKKKVILIEKIVPKPSGLPAYCLLESVKVHSPHKQWIKC